MRRASFGVGRMNKIIKISPNGFQLDSKKWFTVDKFKSLSLLEQIKVNDVVHDIKCNKKGYVVSFSVVGDVASGSDSITPLHIVDCISSTPKLDLKDLKILRGQCLNIAFDNLSSNGRVLNFKDNKGIYINIEEGLDIADVLFERIVERLK
jgi:hypothetical protein